MQFHIDKLALSNTNIFYEQTKPFPESTKEPEAKLPFLKFNDAQLTNVKAHYKSLPEGILLDTDIASFSGVAPKIDLENNDIEISNIVLSNSEVFLEMLASADTTHISNLAASEPEGFIWPNWKVKVDAIKLEENTISYKEAGVQIQPGVFNPAAFKFQNLNLIASEFDFKNKKSSVAVEQLEFLETSGLALKKFSGDIIVSDNQIDVQQLALQLNDNTISGKIAKTIFEGMWAGEGDADSIIESKGLKQMTDSSAIEKIVDEVIQNNPKQLEQYRSGKDKLFGFFVGQVMKESKGKANPKLVNEILKKMLNS